MSFEGLLVTEIFYSIQGETSHSGLPYIFIRLTGCNLRCSYCDSTYAFKNGTKMSFEEVLEKIKVWNCKNILLTGGEPLLQKGTLPFVKILNQKGYQVSIETHGEHPIAPYRDHARIVMDIKTPGSQMSRGKWIQNIASLKKEDEVKFVITSWDDYHFSKNIILHTPLPTQQIIFSPVVSHSQSVSQMKAFNSTLLAEEILKDQLPVRMQIQLHKLLWGAEKTGV